MATDNILGVLIIEVPSQNTIRSSLTYPEIPVKQIETNYVVKWFPAMRTKGIEADGLDACKVSPI